MIKPRKPATWNGKCSANKHGLDFKGQQCDLCGVTRLPKQKFYTGPNTCVKCGAWTEACDEYKHCAPKLKPREPYDYVQALSDNANGDLYNGAMWRRILRKLAREAVLSVARDKWEIEFENLSPREYADAIAKRLVP